MLFETHWRYLIDVDVLLQNTGLGFAPLGQPGSFVYPPSMLTTTTASVDLPPVTGVDLPAVVPEGGGLPACLSTLPLGTSPPTMTAGASLTSGLLSGLSDLQEKAPPVGEYY